MAPNAALWEDLAMPSVAIRDTSGLRKLTPVIHGVSGAIDGRFREICESFSSAGYAAPRSIHKHKIADD